MTVLQGVSLSPIPTCSCAKGLAAGIRIVAQAYGHSGAAWMKHDLGYQSFPTMSDLAAKPKERQVHSKFSQPAQNVEQAPALGVPPSVELASTGLSGAHESLYLAAMLRE